MAWATTHDTNILPSPRRGRWSSSPSGTLQLHRSKWLSNFEKIGDLTGSGSLTAVIKQRYTFGVNFNADGLFEYIAAGIRFRTATFSSTGSLAGTMSELYKRAVQLSGGGILTATAVGQNPYAIAAVFGSEGILAQYSAIPDGLTATVVSSAADGLTAMVTAFGGLILSSAPFTGHGDMAAALYQSHSRTDSSGGVGSMTAVAFERYSVNVGFGD